MHPLYWIAIFAIVIHELPLWALATTFITAIHTVEESWGEIWDELGIPAPAYFVFQLFVSWLGVFAVCFGGWAAALFILIRIGDAVVTHWTFWKPGLVTSPLLLIDAIVVLHLAVGAF